jgi:hypothetical protein
VKGSEERKARRRERQRGKEAIVRCYLFSSFYSGEGFYNREHRENIAQRSKRKRGLNHGDTKTRGYTERYHTACKEKNRLAYKRLNRFSAAIHLFL